jgi:hypothetical protein
MARVTQKGQLAMHAFRLLHFNIDEVHKTGEKHEL